jgi:hypothetical protein
MIDQGLSRSTASRLPRTRKGVKSYLMKRKRRLKLRVLLKEKQNKEKKRLRMLNVRIAAFYFDRKIYLF